MKAEELGITAPEGWKMSRSDTWGPTRYARPNAGEVEIWTCDGKSRVTAHGHPLFPAENACDFLRLEGGYVPTADVQAEIMRMARRMANFSVVGFLDWIPRDGERAELAGLDRAPQAR